jgi:hypothetical protein
VFRHGVLQQENLFADLDTTKVAADDAGEKKKAALSRGLLEPFGHQRCPGGATAVVLSV